MTQLRKNMALLALVVAAGPLAFPSPAHSAPIAKSEQSLAIRAEQAFATLDYETAFELSRQVLALNPRNTAIRRLAAAAAYELGKSGDCLRLMSGLPPDDVTSDDIHTIGECAVKGRSFSPALTRFLERVKSDPSRSDAAHYWLGVAAYRNGQLEEAKGLLEKALVLPSRLADQKRFMLERVEDVMSAKTPPPPAAEAPEGTPPPRNGGTRVTGRRPPPKPLRRVLIPRRETRNGLFTSFIGDASFGAGLGAISEISTLTGDQESFDNEVEASLAEGRDVNPDTITVTDGSLFTPLGTFDAELMTGYRVGDYVGNDGTEYALDLKASASYSKLKGASYAVAGTLLHPSGLRAFPTAGAGARVGGHVDWRFGPSVSARTEAYVDRLAVNFDEQYGQVGGRGSLSLGTESFKVSFGGFWNMVQGDDLVFGGHWNGFELDLTIQNLGLFSLETPMGHSLISYQVSAPIPDAETTGVFQIVSTEGNYVELNIAPTVRFSPYFKTLLWYRFVSGSERSYISFVTKKRQIAQNDFGVKYPDSQYDSSLSELSALIDYTPWSWGGFRAGVAAIFYGTKYNLVDVPPNPSAAGNSPALYTPLLDKGSQNATLAFGTLYARF